MSTTQFLGADQGSQSGITPPCSPLQEAEILIPPLSTSPTQCTGTLTLTKESCCYTTLSTVLDYYFLGCCHTNWDSSFNAPSSLLSPFLSPLYLYFHLDAKRLTLFNQPFQLHTIDPTYQSLLFFELPIIFCFGLIVASFLPSTNFGLRQTPSS